MQTIGAPFYGCSFKNSFLSNSGMICWNLAGTNAHELAQNQSAEE